jgi:hypothetical protein
MVRRTSLIALSLFAGFTLPHCTSGDPDGSDDPTEAGPAAGAPDPPAAFEPAIPGRPPAPAGAGAAPPVEGAGAASNTAQIPRDNGSGAGAGAPPGAGAASNGDPSDPSFGTGGVEPIGAGGTGGSGAVANVVPLDPEPVLREMLSQTGLYADTVAGTLAPGVIPFTPQFQLYTDGADKRRWVYIPEGTQIDTDNMDEWKFPVGTKIWKEFARDGVRVETRMIEKLPEEREDEGFEGWLTLAYIWNDELTDAAAAPMGLLNAKGTDHDVPDQDACGRCHDMRVEKPIGFSAVQLAHDGEGATLSSLQELGLITMPPETELIVPGDETQRAVLGYLHANCGHCHRGRAPVNNRIMSLRLWLETDALGSLEETNAYQALVNQFTESFQGSVHEYRVAGGDPDNSELMRRISLRAGSDELSDLMLEEVAPGDVPMPPLGTELVDEAAVALVREWIATLPAPSMP